MNKLEGFFELDRIGIPSVPWKPFTGNELLDSNLLWTVRVAVSKGNDFNLPRAVGVTAEQAMIKGREFMSYFTEDDLVIYYPFFIAIKSGIILINENYSVIEAVEKDLWNLATDGKRDITVILERDSGLTSKHGKTDFLSNSELEELFINERKIRAHSRRYLIGNSSAMVEWSYAVNTNVNGNLIGSKYLIFYEYRIVNPS